MPPLDRVAAAAGGGAGTGSCGGTLGGKTAPVLCACMSLSSVALTRSIAKPHKQLLKQQLGFAGYSISELYPRRTRRATAVNWLLAHLAERGEPLPEVGPLPPLLERPADPVVGHPGDLVVG